MILNKKKFYECKNLLLCGQGGRQQVPVNQTDKQIEEIQH